MSRKYRNETDEKRKEKVTEILKNLPDCCDVFARSLYRRNKKPQTVYVYMNRLEIFFEYLSNDKHSPLFGKKVNSITPSDLNTLKVLDINYFIDFLSAAPNTTNNYLSAINAFFKALYNEDYLTHNIIEKVERASVKMYEHQVIRMTNIQEAGFINSVSSGVGLTKRQLAFHKNTSLRDYAICLSLIRTGLRVSELVSLDIGDIDMNEKCFSVIRKGNKPSNVYFDDDVSKSLQEYIDAERPSLSSNTAHDPLFVVSQGKYKGERLSVRSVEKIVKKYALSGTPGIGAEITPHKLRATFATNMLKETGNIVLVKEQLDHENIQTTSIYIDKSTMDKKRARNILKKAKDAYNDSDNHADIEDDKGKIYNTWSHD